MAANEASRLSTNDQRSPERALEQGTPIAKVHELPSQLVNELPSQLGAPRPESAELRAGGEQELDELERAAESIRPSWHGAELEVRPVGELPQVTGIPAPLPPPAPLPTFASYRIQPTPYYNADSTVRTSAILPEHLARILYKPEVARATRPVVHAVRFLRTRPLALAAVAGATLLLLTVLFWPSSEPEAKRAPSAANAPSAASTPPPALPAAPNPVAPAATSNAQLAPSAEAAPAPSEAPAVGAKRAGKRAARAPKALATKPREPRKATKPALPAR